MGILADQREFNDRQSSRMLIATIASGVIAGLLSFIGGLIGGAVAVILHFSK